VEHREAELREVVPSGVPDDPARFLRELRHLRNGAGLGHAELAARAHYPCDALLAAEAGPALPDLPVLSAYVRGCGGPVTEWEERWRTLTRSPALTLLPTRDAGCSDAAAAGARIGSASLAADAHDPSIIMAALGRVANGIAAEPVSSLSPSPFFSRTSTAPVPEQPPSVFATDSTPAPLPTAAAVPEAAAELSTPGAVSQGWTPSVVKPVSAARRAPRTRRRVSSRSLIAVIATLVCLAVTFWALFS
jgi:Helix-turn-helix domain